MNSAVRKREARLVLRAQLGDREALDELLRSTQGWLHAYLGRLVGSDADDALQDTLVLVARKLPQLSEPMHFRAWVYRIATREAQRGRRARNHFDIDDAELPPAEEAPEPDVELAALLRERIDQLPPNSRAVVALHYFEELTLREISDVLARPLGTIKSRLAYALGRLRDDMRGTER